MNPLADVNPAGPPVTHKLDFNERAHEAPDWIRDEAAAFDWSEVWRYPDRRALEATLASTVGVDPEQVLVTNGGDEAIQLLMILAADDGPLIWPRPAFSMYAGRARVFGRDSIEVPLRSSYRIDLEALRAAVVTASRPWVIVTRPNNPTGEVVSEDAIERLAKLIETRAGFLFLDEAYVEFAESSLMDSLRRRPNVVILRTFSKAQGLAGCRVGYLVGAAALIERFRRLVLPFNVSSPSLAIARAALTPHAREQLARHVARVTLDRRRLADIVADGGATPFDGQGNFVFADLKRAERATDFVTRLRASGIAVRSFAEPGLESCVRIGVPRDLDAVAPQIARALAPSAPRANEEVAR